MNNFLWKLNYFATISSSFRSFRADALLQTENSNMISSIYKFYSPFASALTQWTTADKYKQEVDSSKEESAKEKVMLGGKKQESNSNNEREWEKEKERGRKRNRVREKEKERPTTASNGPLSILSRIDGANDRCPREGLKSRTDILWKIEKSHKKATEECAKSWADQACEDQS